MRSTRLVIPDEVKCDSGPVGIRCVRTRRMRSSITEEDCRSSLDFERRCFGFIRVATDVVIALKITFVLKWRCKCGRDDFQCSVFNRRIVDSCPKGGASKWICNFEVGIILMPVCATSVSGGF
jgi:hypothetical protein